MKSLDGACLGLGSSGHHRYRWWPKNRYMYEYMTCLSHVDLLTIKGQPGRCGSRPDLSFLETLSCSERAQCRTLTDLVVDNSSIDCTMKHTLVPAAIARFMLPVAEATASASTATATATASASTASATATVVGSLQVRHHIPLLPRLMAVVGLVPPVGSTRVAVQSNASGRWLRSFDGQFVISRWTDQIDRPCLQSDGGVSFGVKGEQFGALTFEQRTEVHPSDPDRVTLRHVRSRLLGMLPFPVMVMRVHSEMVHHSDSGGWDLQVDSYLFGRKFVSYVGPLRLVQDQQQAEEARELLHHVVVFDGHCNLCNSSVDFILANDKEEIFLVGSAQSDTAKDLLRQRGSPHLVDDLNSVLMLPAGGGVPIAQSDAALAIGVGLGGPWAVLATLGKVVPRPVRDVVYNWVGRNRYKWLGQKDTCRLPTKGERARFL